MTAGALDAKSPTFDRVEVTVEGESSVYEYATFMVLPLSSRIRLILAGQPTFYLHDKVVDKKAALSLS